MTVEIPRAAFNPVYAPLLRDEEHRYLVLYGGAGSGKSVFAAQRLLIRLMEKPLCNLLVVRAVAATNRDSTFALMRQVISAWGLEGLFSWTESGPRLICKNGNMAVFKGLDDPEKLKSVTFPRGELTDIWVEEASEIRREDFNQLDLRLRGRQGVKQMTLTFNPVSTAHWLKARFFDQPDPRALVLKSTYKDNRFLDDDYRKTLEGYRQTDPYFYQVYCLGQWGVLGKPLFDAKALSARLEGLPPPLITGDFAFSTAYDPDSGQVRVQGGSIRLVESPQGAVRVYEKPRPGGRYCLGADTAGEGSDYSVAQVVDGDTGRQVCTLRGRLDEDVFAHGVYCLGMWYNAALVAVEVNFSSYPIHKLEELGYPWQYQREGGGVGFRTTAGTRPIILSQLIEIAREHPAWLQDAPTLEEMMCFVRSPTGRPQAQPGAHDDCVMALAIAYHARSQLATNAPWGFSVGRW